MTLEQEALSILHQGQSRKMVDDIIIWCGDSPNRFHVLVHIINSNLDDPIRDRAAWCLSYIAESHPELLKSHWKTLVNLLCYPLVSSPIKRNITRFLQFVEIPKIHHAAVLNKCFELMNDPSQDIAVRVFSMTVLYNLSVIYPEIVNELKISILEIIPHASAGTKNRAEKILKKLEKT